MSALSLATLQDLLDDHRASRNTWTLRLFKNDITPTVSTVAGDLQEATFSGYASQTTTAWGVATSADAGVSALSTEALHLFSHTGGGVSNSIYGYYLTNGAGDLRIAERLAAAPKVMDDVTDVVAVVPQLKLRND